MEAGIPFDSLQMCLRENALITFQSSCWKHLLGRDQKDVLLFSLPNGAALSCSDDSNFLTVRVAGLHLGFR